MPDYVIDSIEKRLPNITAQIGTQIEETDRQLDARASGAILDGLTARWQATRAEVGGYVNALAQRATALEGVLQRLTALRETWTRTRADARASQAPLRVIERIDGVLAAVAASRTRVQEQRTATLVSQDRFAQQLARCEGTLGRIAKIRLEAGGRLLERDSIPLWHAAELARALTVLPDRLKNAVAADVVQLRQFVWDQRWKISLQAALFLGLTLLICMARRRARLWASPGQATTTTALVFERPASAALVLAVVATTWSYPPPVPRAAAALGQVLVLVPAVRIMRLLLDPPLVPGLYVLGTFFLADLVRHFASAVPVLEQQIFLLEMLAGIAVLAWRAARWRRAATAAEAVPGPARALRVATVVVLLAFAAAFMAGVAGYMKLALLLGSGVLGSGYLALVLYTGVRVGDGLVAFTLREGPLRYLGMVRRHRPLLERRAHGLLRWLAIGAWAIFALRYFGLWSRAVTVGGGALAAELHRGSLSISLGDVLVFAATVGAAFTLSAFIRFVLAEDVYPRLHLGRGVPDALSGVLHYTLPLAGFLLALAALGVDLTKITILAGALGVGIGFGLQNVVNNFVSGSIIMFERKINVGDAVQIGDVAGRVQQMGMRACTVRTWEGAEVIVPNASLTSERVVNWTLSDRRRRVDVAVGVAYGTPPEKVLEILLGVARAHPRVLAEPAPAALFRAFGDSALQFELRVWTDRFDLWVQMQSELSVALYSALREAGIEIPFPQREVRLRQG